MRWRSARSLKLIFRTGLIAGFSAFAFFALPITNAAASPANQSDAIQKGRQQFDAGAYAAAIASFQSAVSQQPQSAE